MNPELKEICLWISKRSFWWWYCLLFEPFSETFSLIHIQIFLTFLSHFGWCKIISSRWKYKLDLIRWRTHGVRTLSVFVRTKRPSKKLKMFVRFIQQAYGPIVLEIFYKPQFYYGSLHLFNYLKSAMACLDEPHFEFVKKIFSN